MEIIKPTIIINEETCKRNICRMADKAIRSGVIFRPHFKTHQSADVGEWFREYGVEKITVSSLGMANYFYKAGWKDILVAFPVNILEINEINALCGKITLSLIVESPGTVSSLAEKLKHPVGIYLKIDTGYHRTGLEEDQKEEMDSILDLIKRSGKLHFKGFLTHAGHTYDASSIDEIKKIYFSSVEILKRLKNRYSGLFPESIISVGDTPSCSIIEDFRGVDEIRPGNFVFYDFMQYMPGICKFEDIAISVVCPVVAKHKTRNEIVIYGGAVHLSEARLKDNSFGRVVQYNNSYEWLNPLPNTFIKSISQEHGIIKTTPEFFDRIHIGDLIGIIPVHSCLTANLARGFLTTLNQQLSKY